MKWLKDDSYNAMKQAADNWDKLLNKVLGDNPDMKAEDVTVDQLLDSIESTGNTSDLQEQLSTAQEKLKEKDTLIEQLQSDVAELKGTPAGKKPEAKVCDGCKKRLNWWGGSTSISPAWECLTADGKDSH